jgi:hypothetical protein
VPTDGERLATVEAVLQDLRSDVTELRDESLRARARLHNLEGIAGAFLDMQKTNRRAEERQYRKLGVKIQVAGLLLTLAAIVSPILAVLLAGK